MVKLRSEPKICDLRAIHFAMTLDFNIISSFKKNN